MPKRVPHGDWGFGVVEGSSSVTIGKYSRVMVGARGIIES